MKPRKTNATPRLWLLLALATLVGCTSAPRASVRVPVRAEDNTLRLMQHPEYPRAAYAAPAFVTEAFNTITRLEREKANAGGR